MHAIRQELIPPSGVSHAIALTLVPPRRAQAHARGKTLCQLVVARSSLLRVFDVVEQREMGVEEEQGVRVKVEEGEAANGESENKSTRTQTRTRLHLVREHRLHGHVTGLDSVRTLASGEDGLDRLLVSFKDAKIALLEWSDASYDLSTVSLHTYERTVQVSTAETYAHRPLLRADPSSRCAALLLPQDALAILPFVQRTGLDPDPAARERDRERDMPYLPSYVLPLAEADSSLRHILDFCFLPGFHTPTLALLLQPSQTWTGRLTHARDTTHLAILTLDPHTKTHSVIARTPGLPYDAHLLLPAPASSAFGGVVVLCGNSVLHVDPSGRVTGLAASAWHGQVSALKFPLWPLSGEEGEAAERRLEGARVSWGAEQQLLIWGAEGWVREIELVLDGRSVSSLRPGRRLGRTSPPAVVRHFGGLGELVLLGSESAQSVLLRVVRGAPRERVLAGEEIEGEDMSIEGSSDPGEGDDLADIYGESGLPSDAAGQGAATALPWLELEVCDALPGHGAVADMAFALSSRNGLGVERATPKLVCSTPAAGRGAWTIWENGLPVRVKRKLPAVAGTRGVWSLRVLRARGRGRREVEEGEREWDNLVISTDATPAPGISRTIIAAPGGVQIVSRLPTLTISAGAFFGHTCVLQVTPGTLRLLDGEGKELQVVKDSEGNKDSSPIVRACVEDPWVLVQREDGVVALYLGDAGRRRLRYKGLPSQREKTTTYAAAYIYTDWKGLMPAPAAAVEIEPASAPVNPRKRRASSLEAVEDVLKEDEERLAVEPESKRRRLRSSDEKEHEKKEMNGASRSTRHSARDKEREKERSREHSRERERSKDKDKDRRRDEKSDRKESRRRKEGTEDSRRHKDSKDGKENGSSRSHRHRDSLDRDKESKEKERGSRRHESERRKAPEEEAPSASQWLLLYNANGRLEIWWLPKMTLVFSTRLLNECRAVLDDAAASLELAEGGEEDVKVPPLQVEDVVLCPIGDDVVKLYLLVYYTEGRLAIYEATPIAQTEASGTLDYRFVKVATHFADAEQHASIRQMLPEARRLQLPSRRALIPFASETKGGISAVFQRGEEPCWIMASRQTGLRIIPYSSPIVYSFTPTSLFGSTKDFILYGEEGPVLMEFDEEPDTSRELSCTRISSTRPYTSMAVDPGTNLVAAASSLKSPFLLYDDEEQPLWVPESAAFFSPLAESSSLELISPDTWQTLDGYDFDANEFINTVKSVTLETPSSESGFKDYIAVGTSTFRGEDLAVRGATYIFEVIEVVSYPGDSLPPYRLKLLCRDEAKAPVNSICGMNGYLVSSQGFKVFVRAFEQDERLVGVAFLDAGVCVTSLTCLKNLLLIGDAKRSVSFVAFQEDPFKLVPLARDHRPTHIVDSAFLFDEGDFSILAADDEGNLRMFEFDPGLAGATHGNPLLCTTEFNGQSEHTHILAVAGRHREDPEEVPIPEAQLIFGTSDGSLGTISPVPDDALKRLQLLSGQLMRSVQHFAGLNPRAFRTVRNDHLSRPLNKGILDYDLLHAFQELDIRRQATITKQIGTDTITVLRDIRSLQDIW